MFDPYSQTRDHARKVAHLRPATMTTWQDAARQIRYIYGDLRSGSSLSRSLLRTLRRVSVTVLALSMIIVLVLWACTPFSTQLISEAPVSTEANMPNPASAYCKQQGYRVEIRTAADGSQSGSCIFPDGSECDKWAYFRGECAPAIQAASRTEIPTAIPIDPADYQGWWTYTHPIYDFSIMLPEDWKVEEVTTGEPAVIKTSLIVGTAGFILLLLANTFATVLLTTGIFTCSITFLRPSIHSLTSKRTAIGQGASMGLSNSFVSLGRVVGPIVAGIVFDINPNFPYLSGAFILLAVFIMSLVWVKNGQLATDRLKAAKENL